MAGRNVNVFLHIHMFDWISKKFYFNLHSKDPSLYSNITIAINIRCNYFLSCLFLCERIHLRRVKKSPYHKAFADTGQRHGPMYCLWLANWHRNIVGCILQGHKLPDTQRSVRATEAKRVGERCSRFSSVQLLWRQWYIAHVKLLFWVNAVKV